MAAGSAPAPGLQVQHIPGKALGLVATSPKPTGTQVYVEDPTLVLQHTGNRRLVSACAFCCGFVGTVTDQLEAVFREPQFEPLLQKCIDCGSAAWWQELWKKERGNCQIVRCSQGCGEMYCSEMCRINHWAHSHNLLCVGPIESEDHPLMRFKYHAIEHADTIMLSAQAIAHIVNRAKASGGGGPAAVAFARELFGYAHAPFRDATKGPPGRPKDADFYRWADQLVMESTNLLRAALEPHAPAEVAALFDTAFGQTPILSELLGLFEYCNLDVEVSSPMQAFFFQRASALMQARQGSIDPADAQRAHEELKLLEALLREKTYVMNCGLSEETTGIFDDEGDAEMPEEDPTPGLPVDEAAVAREELEMVTEAQVELRKKVNQMSMEQLLAAPWPAMHGIALFGTVARLNHSCAPNVKLQFPGNNARINAFAIKDIPQGQELTICYIKVDEAAVVRRRKLKEYGFDCVCERCVAELGPGIAAAQVCPVQSNGYPANNNVGSEEVSQKRRKGRLK